MKRFIITLIAGIVIGLIPTSLAIGALNGRFSDVSDGSWYSKAVNNLAEKGIISGYEDGTFGPSRNVNRAELAVLLNRMLNFVDTGLASNHFIYCADSNSIRSANEPEPNETEINEMWLLFETNNLDNRNFVDCDLSEKFGPLKGTDVICKQYVNGLRVHFEDLRYSFDEEGKLYKYGGMPNNEITSIDLDNLPSMKINEIAELYIDEVSNDSLLSSNTKKGIMTGCYELEFGYYDLNASQSEVQGANFTKAWRIRSKNNRFNQAAINDITSELIWYDNGINVDS